MNETKTRECMDCGQEYEPEYWKLLSIKLLKGAGRCPKCVKKYGAELDAKERAESLANMASRRRDARGKVGIPPRYMSKDFSNFDKGRGKQVESAFTECWKYAEDYPVGGMSKGYRSLYIYSENSWGVGKTHLSCAIAHRILDRWQDDEVSVPRIKWVSEPDLFGRIQASFNYTAEEKQLLPNASDIIKELVYCDLLILDDVGKEKRIDPRFVQRTLFAIINGRYDRDYPMVVTANLKPSLITGHLGTGGTDEASYDRFVEMCQNKRIPIDGDSYRRG